MREPGYYWVTRGYDPFIARWSGNSWLCGWSAASIKVLSERIPAPGEPCTCEAARRATHEMAEKPICPDCGGEGFTCDYCGKPEGQCVSIDHTRCETCGGSGRKPNAE